MFNRIVEVLSVPIMFLNMASGIVGGIWLAILGEWPLVGIGVLLVFTAHYYLSFLQLLGAPLILIAMHFYKKKNPLGHLFGFLSQFYTNLLIIGTCVFAFFVCMNFYDGEGKLGLIPYLLWSWDMALGPWYFFASHEPDNEFSAITLFSASVFYLLFLVSTFISPLLTVIILIIFGVVQLIVLPIFMMCIANQTKDYY